MGLGMGEIGEIGETGTDCYMTRLILAAHIHL
jgi:hypothetical protein